jgi:hypothetical protein
MFVLELDFDTNDYNIANCVLNFIEDGDSLNYSIESSSFLKLESRYIYSQILTSYVTFLLKRTG